MAEGPNPTVAERSATFHRAADSIEATTQFARRAVTVAAGALLAMAVAVIVWGALSFRAEVHQIEVRQSQFHSDATCQTAALDRVLIELADAQQDQTAGRPIPRFVYPKPC